jgi:hypothetical protein
MAFDIQGARKEGYSDREIADYLASQKKFDVTGARKEGYRDDEIISHLSSFEPKREKPKEPGLIDRATGAIKELVSGPGSVMDKVPTTPPGQKEVDERLALGQGPIRPEVVQKARDVREGIAKLEEQPETVKRVAKVLEEKKEPTFRGLVDRATELQQIEDQAETARRKQFARERPLLSSLQSGLATTLAGNINIPSVAADAFNQTFVNPILTVAGLDPLPKVPLAYGTEYLAKAAEEYMPSVGKQKLGEAFDKKEATDWLFSNLAANSPQMVMSLAGAYAPALRATILPAMGGTAAGSSYAAGDQSQVAVAKGAVEVLTEMLPLQVFDKVGDVLKGLSVPKQRTILTIAGQRLAKTGADITAVSLTNAVEEAAAQFGGNVLDKYFQGKDVALTDDLLEASVLGAASGTAMTAPRAAMTLAGRGEPLTPEQQIAQALEAGVAGAQPVGTREAAVRALSPQTYDQTLISPQETVDTQTRIEAISQATTVDDAISAATEAAGEVPLIRSYAPSLAPAAAAPLTAPEPILSGVATPEAVPVITPPAALTPGAGPVITPPTITPPAAVTPEAVELPESSAELEQRFGLDQLRQAPRPQRIQGKAVADLSDDDLRAVVEDDAAPAITRRGAQIELDARSKEVVATTIPSARAGSEAVLATTPEVASEVAATTPTEVSRETTENFIDIPADTSAAALPNADAEPVGGVAAADEARATAQEAVNRWAASENRTDAPVLNPAPAEEDAAVNQIATALNSQFGGRVYAFHDTQPDSVNGFALGGTAFVNTASPTINVAKTSLHEFKHTVEQIAEAERRQGLTNTPAQQFTSSIDSIFSDMTEEGRRAYSENFLHKAELDAIADPFAREQRLRQLLQEPLLVSEMTADFLGNRATDKAFWRDVARADPEGFRGFVGKWISIIDNLLTTLRGTATQKKGESAKVDQYIRDLNKAKMVARDALIAYRRGTLQQMPAAAGTPAMSLREGEVSEANIPARGEGVQPAAERAGPPAAEAGRGEIPSYGEAREGAISVVGRHYSPRVQTSLNSAYYGTGLRGAEGSRLRESRDSRISNRIYFYVDTGEGIRPESGVGRFAHEVQLNNIYDPATRLIPPQGSSNAFESAVIDAGFDGYIAPFGRGAAVVLLGPKHGAVPVKSLDQAPAFAKRQIPKSIDAFATLETVIPRARKGSYSTNRQLKVDLQTAILDAARKANIDLTSRNDETVEYLVRVGVADALYALKSNANAVGWYDKTVTKALRILGTIHPEINTDPNAKFAFTWALAVTSNGLKVDKNFELAERAYQAYKRTGKMPTDITAGQAQKAINEGLDLFNTMVAEYGIDGVRKFMDTAFTVAQIKRATGLEVTGEFADTSVRGAAVLGPKIGNGFFSNLNGFFDQLTMDRWLMRTWGRWTGTLIEDRPDMVNAKRDELKTLVAKMKEDEAAAAEFEEALGTELQVDDLDALALAIQKASMLPETRAKFNKTETGTSLRKTGNALAKYLDGQKEAPAGPEERNFIRLVFNNILEKVRAAGNEALTMSDLQALLWYPEKRLYDIAKSDENAAEGYEDDEAPDYANAAAKLARSLGVSDQAIQQATRDAEKDYETRVSARPAGPVSGGAPAEAGVPPAVRGFVGREKRSFLTTGVIHRVRSSGDDPQSQPNSYKRKSGGDDKSSRVLGIPSVAVFSPVAKFKNALAEIPAASPTFFEVDAEGAETFRNAIQASKDKSPFGAAVYVYDKADYEGMRLFLTEDGKAGFALKGDDIVSVFADETQRGAGNAVLQLAVQEGGRRLDAFDTVLPAMYAVHGFKPVARVGWNDEYAPSDWDKTTFKEFNNGEPDVVFMVHDPASFEGYTPGAGKKISDYDQGAVEQGKALESIQQVRQTDLQSLESLFKDLEKKKGLARARVLSGIKTRPDAAAITYIEKNFLDILSELEDSGKVKINCD